MIAANPEDFRIFGPDETASNRLDAVFEVTDKQWNAALWPIDDDNHLARAGRVVEMLSEHQCQGWLEGYLLTGRHGVLNSYEAFVHIVDSMFNQHAKWLKTAKGIPWRRPISSLNYLLSSHVWRQDHNGLSHQDPGFIDHVVNKKADVVRVYLPFDANTPPVDLRSLSAFGGLRQRRRRRQAAGAELVDDVGGHRTLQTGAGHPGMGRERADGSGTGPSSSLAAGDVPDAGGPRRSSHHP